MDNKQPTTEDKINTYFDRALALLQKKIQTKDPYALEDIVELAKMIQLEELSHRPIIVNTYCTHGSAGGGGQPHGGASGATC